MGVVNNWEIYYLLKTESNPVQTNFAQISHPSPPSKLTYLANKKAGRLPANNSNGDRLSNGDRIASQPENHQFSR